MNEKTNHEADNYYENRLFKQAKHEKFGQGFSETDLEDELWEDED